MKLPRRPKAVWDRRVILWLVVIAIALAARAWLADHPQHNPWAPLDLRDPPGWATAQKLVDLRGDPEQCRAVLQRSGVAFTALSPTSQGECSRPDRTVLSGFPLSPTPPPTTCPVAAGMSLWLSREVQPAAQQYLGSGVARIEHLGSYSCRRMYGASTGRWSEHATGNAIDIAAFVLEDGRRVSLLGDWQGEGDAAAFLRATRDGACNIFGTVLSPDYNAAHADHFHFDQDDRSIGTVCR